MSPEFIASVFTGLTALIAASSTFVATRSKRVSDEQRLLKKRARILEAQVLALVSHMFTLEYSLAKAGGTVPPRPEILEEDYDG